MAFNWVRIDSPADDYLDTLVDGLRYPWLLPAERAAEALAALRPEGAVPRVERLLEEPDPDIPFVKEINGKPVPVVRELVRVNHLRNCLLCHPPSFTTRDWARGAVPSPERDGATYSEEHRPALFVRADRTYLRQDFSLLMKAGYHSAWPAFQRYDFLIRTRPLTTVEREVWDSWQKQARPHSLSRHQQAARFALRELMGQRR
jgi:hypothetical protein